MKLKLAFLLTIAYLFGAKANAATFTAKPGGGDYNNPSTWTVTGGVSADADGIPDSNDNLTIGSGITVTITVDNQACLALTIMGGSFLTFNNIDIFTAYGNITNNGTINGTFSGTNQCLVKAAGSSGIAGTSGTINITGNLKFLTSGYISAGVNVNNTGNIIIGTGNTLGIYGNVTLTGSVDGTNTGSQLQCLTGSVLTVHNQLMATAGTVLATTASYCLNNTIIFDGGSPYSLGATAFENVIIRGSGVKTTSNSSLTTFNKLVTIDPGATLAQAQAITWNGSMLNNGTFSGSTATISYTNASWINNGTFTHLGVFNFSGSAAKTMTGSGSTTFFSLNIQNADVTKSIPAVTINGQLQTITKNFNNSVGTLTIKGFYLSTSGGTMTANASGNTVIISYTNGAIPVTTSGYYNLTLAGTSGTKTLTANTIIANKLTINSLNTLNSNNFNISVGGNWLNNGTFTASAGKTVTFNGTGAQTVSNTVGTTTFKGLVINNNAGVTLTSGTYKLDEVLTISNGTFNTGGKPFTMTSTASQTARIAPITGTGAIAGTFTIQRFITARDTTFADFASPVQNSTFADWAAELPAISYISSPPSQQASAATYDETGDAYVPVTSAGTALNPGQGFEIFLSGNFSYSNFPATTMTTVGIPNQGDQDLSGLISNNAQGWNLVGNPFASSIAWSSIYVASGSASSGLYDYIEMYDYTIADWHGYTSADAIQIGSTQGFWVYGLPGASSLNLIIPESSKTTATNSSIKSLNRNSYFTLTLASGDNSNSFAHTFKIAASSDASDGLDNKDIPFRASLNNSTPKMYSMVEGRKINVNTFNDANYNYSMPIKTQVAITGKYKIEAAGFDLLSQYSCIKLEDKLLNKMIDLNADNNGYSFTMNPSDDADRFIVHFSKDNTCKSLTTSTNGITSDFANQIQILPTTQGNVINFNLSETTNAKISVVNLLGQTIVDAIGVEANTQSINLSLPEGFSGIYLVKVESAKGIVTKKFVRK